MSTLTPEATMCLTSEHAASKTAADQAALRAASGTEKLLARLLKNGRAAGLATLPWLQPVMASPPTVDTVGATAPTGLTKSYLVANAAPDSNFLIQGELGRVVTSGFAVVYGATVPANGNVSATQYSQGFVLDMWADCDEIAIRMIQGSVVMIEVDGQFVSLTPTTLAANGSGPFDSFLHLTFAAKRNYRIKVHAGQGTERIWGVYVKPTASIWRPAVENSPTLQIISDSMACGVGSTLPAFSWPRIFAQACGFEQWVSSSVSSTGFTVASNTAAYDGRLADITTYGPSVIMYCASVNDGPTAAATITARVISTLTAARLLAANAVMIVTGVIAGHQSNDPVVEAAVKAGFDAWQDGNKYWLPSITALGGAHFFGSGTVSSPAGNGNADFYLGGLNGTDIIHPNYNGALQVALRLAWELERVLAAV